MPRAGLIMLFVLAIMLVFTTFVFTTFTTFTLLVFATIPVAVFARAVLPLVLAMRFVLALSFMPLAVAHVTLAFCAQFPFPHRAFAHSFAHFSFAHRVLFVFAALLVPSLGLVESFVKVPHEVRQFIELPMNVFEAGHRRTALEIATAHGAPGSAWTRAAAGRTPRTLAALGPPLVARPAIALAIFSVALVAPRAVAASIPVVLLFVLILILIAIVIVIVVLVSLVLVLPVFLVLVTVLVPVLGRRLVFRPIGGTGVIVRLVVYGLCAECKFDNASAVPLRSGHLVGQREPIRAIGQLFDKRAEPCEGFVEGTIVILRGKQAAADE